MARYEFLVVAAWTGSIFGALTSSARAEDPPQVTPVFKSDFSKRIDFEPWSPIKVRHSPNGQVLVEGNWAPSFTQKALPKHEFLRVRVELVIIGPHGGTDPKDGPDHWTLSVEGGAVLVHTNFRNLIEGAPGLADGIGQSFPDQFPAGLHAAQTGASEIGKFGFDRGDATYEIEVIFPHRGDQVKLEFQVGMFEPAGKKEWGIAKLELEAISGPEIVSEKQLNDLWAALQGEDPVAANKAVRGFIAAGKTGAAFVEKQLAGKIGNRTKEAAATEKKLAAEVEKLVADLDEKEFQKRMAARKQLGDLGVEALPLLEKKLAAKPAPGVRAALAAIIKSMRTRIGKAGGVESHQKLVEARAAHALRILKSADSERTITASTINSPLAPLHDGWVPTEMKGNMVPRFDLWNTEGKEQWVQYSYANARIFDSAEVFWFENKTWDSGAKLPQSWFLSYLDGELWKPVKAKGDYTATYEKFDRIEFEPVETTAIRLTAKGQIDNRVALVEFRLGEKKPAAAGLNEGAGK